MSIIKSFQEDMDDLPTQEVEFSDDLTKLAYNKTRVDKFLRLVNGISNPTSKEELLKRMRMQLINRIAKQLGIKKILFATTCTKLTIELLNNVAIGKGAHISQEMVYADRIIRTFLLVRNMAENLNFIYF